MFPIWALLDQKLCDSTTNRLYYHIVHILKGKCAYRFHALDVTLQVGVLFVYHMETI